jgi:elongator complex protein 3
MLKEAEKISKKNNCKKIQIISGIGVREYYKKFGYIFEKDGEYMSKKI